MAEKKIVPVILAGGKGTRLWPLSRAAAPKQFMELTGEATLFQETLQRVKNPELFEAPIVVTNDEFRFLVSEQARTIDVKLSAIVLEPVARNTAAAIAAAAEIAVPLFGKEACLLVLPSDHKVVADDVYFNAMRAAQTAARAGSLVTFGIGPTEPATGFGYIEVGEPINDEVFHIRQFVEKPHHARAVEMLDAGGYYWNSGIFMFPIKELQSELSKFNPAVVDAAYKAVANAKRDLDFIRLDPAAFSQAPNISIDYALMEKTSNAAVVPSLFNWSDLGSWDAVWKNSDTDQGGNVATGKVTLLDTKNSLVVSRGPHIAVHGLDNMTVVATEDAVYVGPLDRSQDVGKLVAALSASTETSALTHNHPTCYRPWGGYTSVLNGDRFQVKRIFVLPGKKLSLQKHHHRSEHWVVVKGTAEVTIGDSTKMLQENESVYIRVGEIHRLANPGKIMLELIEVQTGSYLGEDDIIRISDDFGRN
jgi:mannose-1-phosphate guanylyltransferase